MIREYLFSLLFLRSRLFVQGFLISVGPIIPTPEKPRWSNLGYNLCSHSPPPSCTRKSRQRSLQPTRLALGSGARYTPKPPRTCFYSGSSGDNLSEAEPSTRSPILCPTPYQSGFQGPWCSGSVTCTLAMFLLCPRSGVEPGSLPPERNVGKRVQHSVIDVDPHSFHE